MESWKVWKLSNHKKVMGIRGAGLLFRLVRTTFLGVSIYQTGKAMGTADYAKDPRAMEKKIRNQLVMSQAFQADENGQPKFPRLLGRLHPQHIRIEMVGSKIVVGARKFVEAKIKSREDKLKDKAFPVNLREQVETELKVSEGGLERRKAGAKEGGSKRQQEQQTAYSLAHSHN